APSDPEERKRDSGEGISEEGIPADLVDRVYRIDKKMVSLRVLPKGQRVAADTIILLLYGYQKLKGMQEVVSGVLLASAKQSGTTLDRIDRTIAVHTDKVHSGGQKRGKRYMLNNQGLLYAEGLLREMFK
ncbi:MAG TPA: hypothetical protein VMT19_02375, partial [Thermoanaerobaculaceae bacterium]|nr:hypothetical protein [Thermoanaerobaculaceae bacterium]